MEDDSEPITSRRSLRPRNAQGRAASSDVKHTLPEVRSSKTSINSTVSDVIDLSDLSDMPDEDDTDSDVEFVPSATEAKRLSKVKRASAANAGRSTVNYSEATSSSDEYLARPSTSKGVKVNSSKTRNSLGNKLVPSDPRQQNNNNGTPPMLLVAQNRQNNQVTPQNIVKFTMWPPAGTEGNPAVAPTVMLQTPAGPNRVYIPVNATANTNSFTPAQLPSKRSTPIRDLPSVKIPAKTYSKTVQVAPKLTVGKRVAPAEQQILNNEPNEKVHMVYLKCAECSSEFHLRESYYGHIKHDHRKKPYKCLLRNCLVGFDDPNEYNEHVKTRHNLLTMYNCAKCPQVFKSYEYLANHEELCHMEGLFQCSFCTLTSSKRMPIHMHHLQKHHHVCQDCPRVFPSKNDLKIHVKQAHPNRQPIVVQAQPVVPVKQLLKKQPTKVLPAVSLPVPAVQVPIVEPPLPPLPPEPEENFCDPSRLLDVRLKEEELDEDVQVIRHPKKRKMDDETSTPSTVPPQAVLQTVVSPSTSNGIGGNEVATTGPQKTRYLMLRRSDGTEQMVALAPGVNFPTTTTSSGLNGAPKKVMVVVQKGALNKKGVVNGSGKLPIVGQVANVLQKNSAAVVVEEVLEDAIYQEPEGSVYYTIIKLNCLVRCPKEFTSKKELLKHMDEAHCILPFRCLHRGCGRSFGELINLNRHVIHHVRGPERGFKCSYCDSTFLKHSLLAEHLFNRHELGEFACRSDGCTYRSISRGLIDEHYKKEHLFLCSVTDCSAHFNDKNELEEHEKTHDGFRRYYCKMDHNDTLGCTFQTTNKKELFAHVKKAREGAVLKDVNLKDYVGVITGWHPKTIKKLLFEEEVVEEKEEEISQNADDSEVATANESVQETPVAANGDENGVANDEERAAPIESNSDEIASSTVEAMDVSASDAAEPSEETSAAASNASLSETPEETNEISADTNNKPLEASTEIPMEVSEALSEVNEDAPAFKGNEPSVELCDSISSNMDVIPSTETNEPSSEAFEDALETHESVSVSVSESPSASKNDAPLEETIESPAEPNESISNINEATTTEAN